MLRKYLAGFQPKQPQIVGNMTVIPLVSTEKEFKGIAGAENVRLQKDIEYGSLELVPCEDEITIVPNGYTIITKERAQDRTVPAVHILQKSKRVNSYCVQSSQSGLMNPNKDGKDENKTIRLLPLAVRHCAYNADRKNDRNIGALWGKLGEINRQLGVNGDYLVNFFNRFQKDLEQFVAQFEPIPNQRGAIVLINGRVVGIDIMPSSKSFFNIWEMLIRDCYGGEAIRLQNQGEIAPIATLDNVNSIDRLLTAVQVMAENERKWAYDIVKAVLDQEAVVENDSVIKTKKLGKLAIKRLLSDELEGQVILDKNDCAVYLSLFRYVVKKEVAKAFPI